MLRYFKVIWASLVSSQFFEVSGGKPASQCSTGACYARERCQSQLWITKPASFEGCTHVITFVRPGKREALIPRPLEGTAAHVLRMIPAVESIQLK